MQQVAMVTIHFRKENYKGLFALIEVRPGLHTFLGPARQEGPCDG